MSMFQHDLPALFVGVALCTIAAGLFAFSLLGRRIADIDCRSPERSPRCTAFD